MRVAHSTVAHSKIIRICASISLLLLVTITVWAATHSRATAQTTSPGLLSIQQPARNNDPAAIRFYTPDAQLVHILALRADATYPAAALAPDGRHLAYLTGNVSGPEAAPDELQADLTLHIARTTDGSVVNSIPLLPANFPTNIAINADLLRERDDSLAASEELEEGLWQVFRYSLGQFAWSPDGTQLAFSAAIDGPSSDLYLFDTTTTATTRLTDGIEQIDAIRWSPAGNWIWHSTLAYGYCQACGGHHFAAAADGSAIVTLPGDDVYRFLAWVDDFTYLVTDQANGPGDFNLQRVDITTGQSTTLWAGTHQSFIYDPAANRLGLLGTRGQHFEPEQQVFSIDLARPDEAAAITEYADLTSARAAEPWLAPLGQFPVTHPCQRSGAIVYPCIEGIYDPISPDGTLTVTANYAVQEIASGAQLLPRETELAPDGRILWRRDGAGFYITQPNLVVYRALATGDYTVLDNAQLIDWLPAANATTFAATTPPAPPPLAPVPLASPTPYPTPLIENPMRINPLVNDFDTVTQELRVAHARELTTIAQAMTTSDHNDDIMARRSGLNLLLAHEAAHTYLDAPALGAPSVRDLDPTLEAELIATLDAALVSAPPLVATYPANGRYASAYAMALSSDGKYVATGDAVGNVYIWDYAAGMLLRVLLGSAHSIDALQFSADSAMLAASDYYGNVTMWQVASGLKTNTHVGQFTTRTRMAWRPGTRDLAVSNGDVPLMIHPTSRGAYLFLDPALNATAEALAYSADGALLAIALDPDYALPPTGPIRQAIIPEERPIWIVNADTGAILHEIEDDRTTDYLAFTPDGATLLVGSSYRLRAWSVATQSLRYEVELSESPQAWAMTPDGTQLATLTRSAGITFYDLQTGTATRSFWVEASILSELAIHPTDGNLILTDLNGPPILLDPANGTPAYRFGTPRARHVTISPVAPLLATADVTAVTLYDLNTRRVRHTLLGAAQHILDIAFSQDGKWLAAREEGGALTLWEVDRGTLLWRVDFTDEYGSKVAFANDGRIITGGSDGILWIVDPADGSVIAQIEFNAAISALAVNVNNQITLGVGRPDAIPMRLDLDDLDLDDLAAGPQLIPAQGERLHVRGPLAYTPDGSLLALPRGHGFNFGVTLELWPTAPGASLADGPIRTIEIGNIYQLSGLAFSRDGTMLATAADDNLPITIWDVTTGTTIQTLGEGAIAGELMRLAFDPSGDYLYASGFFGVTRQYAITPTHALRTRAAHDGSAWDVAIFPNGRWAITAGDDHHIRVWDWETGTQQYHVLPEPDRVRTVAVSPAGDTFLTGSYDGSIRLYSNGGFLRQTFGTPDAPAHTDMVSHVAFRPDGDAFASASFDGSVTAWHLRRNAQAWRVTGLDMGVGALAYAPDSSLLAGSAGGPANATVYLWDAYTGEEVMQLTGHSSHISGLAFSPDSTLLASASWDRTVKLWDVASGDEVATLTGHTELLTDLAFSPDGAHLATIAEDYTLRIWEIATATEATRIDLPRILPWAIAYSPDGHALLTTHADGTLRTWLADATDTSLRAQMSRVAARVPRPTAQFTAQERAQYALDAHIGSYPLSASGNVNLRGEPYLQSLVVRPPSDNTPETLIALTNEKFLLTSTDQGENWRIVTRLPLTYTFHSLSLLARPSDPLLITSKQGLFAVGEDGTLTLIHDESLRGVSYSHTNPDELWAVRGGVVYKSDDRGATWGTAANDLLSNELFAPLLNLAPNNNPQIVVGQPLDAAWPVIWRGAGNGYWQRLDALPRIMSWRNPNHGLAWDNGNRTLYWSGAQGELFASINIDAPDPMTVSATVIADFTPGTRPYPLAVGAGPSLYINLLTNYGPRTLRGEWDGETWHWIELRLPLVGAG